MNLVSLYEVESLSLNQIVKRTGQPYSRVRNQLIRAGVKLRSQAVGAQLQQQARIANRRPRMKRRT